MLLEPVFQVDDCVEALCDIEDALERVVLKRGEQARVILVWKDAISVRPVGYHKHVTDYNRYFKRVDSQA